ncbi:MAG: glucose-1-phosphate cytidylyltransferase [Candidatus Pacebacteria bacterium]|nr:glucose-1-phosphate cytidylyltransferase [Candidatus Paceibacterota bacterium]
MKVVILAGGFGTRLSEETKIKPKPMVEIGDKPILWHIMKIYSHYGFNDFVICLGYKGYYIKEWFNDYFLHNSDVTLNLEDNTITYHNNRSEKWKITLVDTGSDTMTGGRIKRIKDYVGDEPFLMTYGDGVADIDIPKLVEFHKKNKGLATITSVTPEGRFGTLITDDTSTITSFSEKTDNKNRVNGGFFVLESKIFEYIEGDDTIFEKGPLEKLAKESNLKAFIHNGFWKPMDTLHDKSKLEEMWNKGDAPWKIW